MPTSERARPLRGEHGRRAAGHLHHRAVCSRRPDRGYGLHGTPKKTWSSIEPTNSVNWAGSRSARTMTPPLSCESLSSALTSAGALLGVSPGDLERRLLAVSDELLTPSPRNGWADPDEALLHEALGVRFSTLPPVPGVLWFHATRAEPGATFSEGLLPTDQVAPRLEARLRELARNVEREASPCIDSGGLGRLQDKLRGGALAGPFAFLLRDVAANPSTARDFTCQVPEVVEELALWIDAAQSAGICAAYRDVTRRCIVTFVARQQRSKVLARAVYYAHLKLRGVDPEPANANFVGNGQPVPGADIIRVEFLE
jgi:hypothetical protein